MLDLETRPAFPQLRSIGAGNGVIASERTNLSIATVLSRKQKSAELAAALTKLKSTRNWTVIGTGPGKWLVLQDDNAGMTGDLASALGDLANVVDQSGALGVLRLSGPSVMTALEKGVKLDIRARDFSSAVTAIAHVGVTIWKVDDTPTFDLAVARSLTGSFLHWLETSAAAYGLVARNSAYAKN